MISAKQGAIMLALQERGMLTLAEAVELVGKDIYCNASNHVGNILSRMVARKLIVREKPGVFKLAPTAPRVEVARGWWED